MIYAYALHIALDIVKVCDYVLHIGRYIDRVYTDTRLNVGDSVRNCIDALNVNCDVTRVCVDVLHDLCNIVRICIDDLHVGCNII